MSIIATAAREALTASRSARETEAKATLVALLGTKVPAASLRVVDTNDDVVVFTDGTTHLAVGQEGVRLVTGSPGDWSHKSDPLADLAALGKALS